MRATEYESFMRRALALAERGRGRVEPNPSVGAVVVRGGRVAGEGYHRQYGGPHAEVRALARAGSAARGATLVVTLEPCSTTGKTPPCTEAVLRSGVARAVIGARDPDPRHRHRGVRALRSAGIEVVEGVLAGDCAELAEAFRRHLEDPLPFVTAKWAMTLDGQVATRTGASRWITSEASRREGHRERARSDAIVTGVDTVLADDPRLTARGARGLRPVRIVFDSRLRTSPEAVVVRTAREQATWLVCTRKAPARARRSLESLGCRVLVAPSLRGRVDLLAALASLREEGVARVLLEGGPTLSGEALRRGAIHRVLAFVGGRLFGGSDGAAPLAGVGCALPDRAIELEPLRRRAIGERDTLIEGLVPSERPPRGER